MSETVLVFNLHFLGAGISDKFSRPMHLHKQHIPRLYVIGVAVENRLLVTDVTWFRRLLYFSIVKALSYGRHIV